MDRDVAWRTCRPCERRDDTFQTLVPTFRSSYTISAITFYELRKAMGTSKFMILVPLFDLKSLGSFRRLWYRDFKPAALVAPHPKCFLKKSIAMPQASSAALRSCTDCRCSLTKACSASYRNSSSDLPADFIAFSKLPTNSGVHQSSLVAKCACSGIFTSAGFAACSGGMP